MNQYYQQPYPQSLGGAGELTLVNAFMRRVYNWMAAGLVLSAVVAWYMTTSLQALSIFINLRTGAPTMMF